MGAQPRTCAPGPQGARWRRPCAGRARRFGGGLRCSLPDCTTFGQRFDTPLSVIYIPCTNIVQPRWSVYRMKKFDILAAILVVGRAQLGPRRPRRVRPRRHPRRPRQGDERAQPHQPMGSPAWRRRTRSRSRLRFAAYGLSRHCVAAVDAPRASLYVRPHRRGGGVASRRERARRRDLERLHSDRSAATQPTAAQLGHRFGARVEWLPFDLHPEYPAEGHSPARLLARYGDGMTEHVRSFFAARGLEYNPHQEVVPNSMAALRLTELARDRGRHGALHDRLMDAYWAEARNIGDPDVLREEAAVGLPARTSRTSSPHGATANRRGPRGGQRSGANAVPAFVLNRRLSSARSRRAVRAGVRPARRDGGEEGRRDRRLGRVARRPGPDEARVASRSGRRPGSSSTSSIIRSWRSGSPTSASRTVNVQLLDRHNRDCRSVAERLGGCAPRRPAAAARVAVRPPPRRPLPLVAEVALWWPERRLLSSRTRSARFRVLPRGRRAAWACIRSYGRPRSLRGLVPDHLLVGHGEGIHHHPAALEDALRTARRRIPLVPRHAGVAALPEVAAVAPVAAAELASSPSPRTT